MRSEPGTKARNPWEWVGGSRVSRATAEALIDFGGGDGRLAPQLAAQQLDGAVGFHNATAGERVGYAQNLLLRNRATPVVAFGFDSKDRLIAWVEHPAATLQPVEAALVLVNRPGIPGGAIP